ncbi:hypothetical protein GQX74_001769 [Glossina fuscipes]|nr:hypothetical protein GQX74_001769 [Glossina fuscipes]
MTREVAPPHGECRGIVSQSIYHSIALTMSNLILLYVACKTPEGVMSRVEACKNITALKHLQQHLILYSISCLGLSVKDVFQNEITLHMGPETVKVTRTCFI